MHYKVSGKEVMKNLGSFKEGLSGKEAKKRLRKYGKNTIERKKKISAVKIFLNQFINPLVVVLIAATVISVLIQHYIDAIVIGVILVLNAILGFMQEYKAEKAIEMLDKLRSFKANVLRNNKLITINTSDLVPGDVIVLETGDRVPADARLLEIVNLMVEEAPLTGESAAVDKTVKPINRTVALGDQTNMIFSGTTIVEGRCKAVITETGEKTEIGKIARSLDEIETEPTPLQKKLKELGKWLTIGVIIVTALVIPVGLIRGMAFFDLFLTAISLAVAAIPEGLPAVVTITLALGIRRMLKRKALIRKLKSVETLGSVTVICSDKTGTLTRNEMTVTDVFGNLNHYKVTGKGYDTEGAFLLNNKIIKPLELKSLLTVANTCNNASIDTGDPTERALKVLAAKHPTPEVKRVKEIPFSSETKYMAIVDRNGKYYVKGAVETILKQCKNIEVDFDKRVLSYNTRKIRESDKKLILEKNQEFASKALRVLALAYGEKDNLTFCGLVGMIDPPRKEVKHAIAQCKQAGIRPVMITGDHAVTAKAIAKRIGLKCDVMIGEELDKLTDEELRKKVKDVCVFARVSSIHKVRILKSLQENNEVVAMTGDGVNDAPALKKSDVGISMNIKGTDIARDVSDIILLNDHFASIVSAVREGRIIYQNIKKFIKFLLGSNIDEVAIVFISLLAGLPLPMIPVQILWINLATDSLPALALGIDPPEPGIMNKKPRKPNEGIFHNMTGFLTFISIYSILILAGLFLYYLNTSTIEHARTMVFAAIICLEIFFVVFATRSRTVPLYKLKRNYYLMGAVVISTIMLLVTIYTPLSQYFYTVPLSIKDWLMIIPVTLLGLVIYEISKLFKKVYK